MPNIEYVLPGGKRQTVVADDGETLMHAALNNLVPGIVGECGGELSCATCHVYVAPEWADRFPPQSGDENDMLKVTADEPTEYSRLACQLRSTAATDGAVVVVPDVQ
ncbi:2Fe-2S iron-sulfur cluster-binding protein [Streptomyces sp. JV176]|uniref:2Fe-2S iron-sulfur cluster-binding protein n=1 Tax=Streptomyces sp. JV176 TaxID=858630 RepID=UPI002E76385B|nr:2Fe-2S iron-sulfur cluster-binding protein [Streptomyces sp. JV176]MEE1799494.1 2Fe-2S iron-sulfur cluster-binding protein [Streptomyces sp. JV176]